jgi:RNA polymerase sigma-70 factor (sigma-E family)
MGSMARSLARFPGAAGRFLSTKTGAQASVAVMMRLVVAPPEQDRPGPRDLDLRDLYREHRSALVRLAALLVGDEAEEVVHDAFVRTHLAWDRLRDSERALSYLRSAVLNGARSRLRHLRVVERTVLTPPGAGPSAESAALAGEEHRRVIATLRSLPGRQKECLALRYYLDLSEAEIAAALGISPGSVKTHVHRGLAALAERLEEPNR